MDWIHKPMTLMNQQFMTTVKTDVPLTRIHMSSTCLLSCPGELIQPLTAAPATSAMPLFRALLRSIHNLNISPIKSGSLKCLSTKNVIISSANEYPTCQAWNAEFGASAKLSHNIIAFADHRSSCNWSCRACVLKALSAPRLQIPETSHQLMDFSILGHRTDHLGTPTRFSAADWYATGYARKRWSTPSWHNEAKLAGHQISKTCLKIKKPKNAMLKTLISGQTQWMPLLLWD